MSKLWVGSFFDRFGAYKLAVLSHPDTTVQAAVKDCMVRRYIDTVDRHDELVELLSYVVATVGLPFDPVELVEREATADELWYEDAANAPVAPVEEIPLPLPAFVATHVVAGLGQAMLGDDGTVRFADGRWSTVEALAAMGKTLEAL